MKGSNRRISIRTKILMTGTAIIVVFSATILAYFIPAAEQSILDKKKEMIRELTRIAAGTAANFYAEYQAGRMTEEAAREAAREHVRKFRYGSDGKEYFWINTAESMTVLHPYRPDLEGKSLAKLADARGKLFIAEISRICLERGDIPADIPNHRRLGEHHRQRRGALQQLRGSGRNGGGSKGTGGTVPRLSPVALRGC